MTPEIKNRIEQIQRGEVPEGYKKTRIGIVPEEWQILKLRDMFDRLNRKNKVGNTNVLTISAQHGLISQEEYFNKSIASEDKSGYFLLKRGDFAYNKSYSKGYPFGAIKPLTSCDEGIVSPLYICFEPSTRNTCPEYYAQYFDGGLLNREIQAVAQEGARNHGLLNIGVDDFFSSTLVVPPLAEQKKIAEILAAQDKVIELKEKLLEEKKKQKKYLMQQLLTGKKRLPGFSDEWKTIKLKDISKKITRKNSEFTYSVVLSNSAQYGIIPQEEQFDKDIANSESIDGYYVVNDGDFVYNPRISVAAPCGPINVNETGITGVMSPLYTVFSVTNEQVNNTYLKHYFKSAIWFKYMKSIANYGARHDRMSITDNDFFEMPILIPSTDEQTATSDVLSLASKEIDILKTDVDKEKQKKKALMQLLLTGIVRVNV